VLLGGEVVGFIGDVALFQTAKQADEFLRQLKEAITNGGTPLRTAKHAPVPTGPRPSIRWCCPLACSQPPGSCFNGVIPKNRRTSTGQGIWRAHVKLNHHRSWICARRFHFGPPPLIFQLLSLKGSAVSDILAFEPPNFVVRARVSARGGRSNIHGRKKRQ
jgi:hypothetical protein